MGSIVAWVIDALCGALLLLSLVTILFLVTLGLSGSPGAADADGLR